MRVIITALFLISVVLQVKAADTTRFTSAILSRSVSNESLAAIDRAGAWLIDNQQSDGSWQGTNEIERMRANTFARIAFMNNSPSAVVSNCLSRANKWYFEKKLKYKELDKTDTIFSWETMAVYDQCNTPFNLLFNRLIQSLSEKYKELDISKSENEIKITKQIAQKGILSLPEVADNPEAAWYLANAINRLKGGTLSLTDESGNVEIVDWRGDLANHWITSQQIDTKGNGFWTDAETTALVIMLLNQL